jgi:hypothetical protein
LKPLKEQILKSLNVSQPLAGQAPAARFEAAKALASSLVSSYPELKEPELTAWHDCGVSHDGRLEVDVGLSTAGPAN